MVFYSFLWVLWFSCGFLEVKGFRVCVFFGVFGRFFFLLSGLLWIVSGGLGV